MTRVIYSCVLAATLLLASTAAAQSPAPATSPTVEKIHSGWLFVPDVRAADLGGDTGALAGGYLGRITDRSWVVGAGGYVLTNREDDFKLAYAGPVVEWLVRTDRRIGFGVRALVGAGTATLPIPIADVVDPRILASSVVSRRRGALQLWDPDATVAVRDDFFIAEPQVNVMLHFSPGHRLVFGVGYRAVADAPTLGDRLNGLSGSVAFQIGGR